MGREHEPPRRQSCRHHGTSSGIGGATARALAELVACIVAGDRDQDGLDELVSDIESAGGRAVASTFDVTEPGSIASADAVFIGRAMLRDSSWANNVAAELGAGPRFIEQYAYALQEEDHHEHLRHRRKKTADVHLARTDLDWVVVRPAS
ncbi:SDR family NAD(P)-dependent oxidoreductase [Rhodococcus sp. IEGM 1381]|uniref:SDR family NAD(P)-dependent oxidoreductase n=1 Tax=Rhodococcus sp. IEGM 1381 TaxID=3047085 RepID=UPI0024B7EA85|nr:SDR family NAD(P)-dependent oxidoreductase [Rhodococcus sp. IEGM 1381]MDI9897374.1 SDR family NAD(P)-dependent oxidoreductase [Rhodococcus sp. IEGM 1381]